MLAWAIAILLSIAYPQTPPRQDLCEQRADSTFTTNRSPRC